MSKCCKQRLTDVRGEYKILPSGLRQLFATLGGSANSSARSCVHPSTWGIIKIQIETSGLSFARMLLAATKTKPSWPHHSLIGIICSRGDFYPFLGVPLVFERVKMLTITSTSNNASSIKEASASPIGVRRPIEPKLSRNEKLSRN